MRAVDALLALRAPGPAGRFLVDADEMSALEEAARPFRVVLSMNRSAASAGLTRQKRQRPEPEDLEESS